MRSPYGPEADRPSVCWLISRRAKRNRVWREMAGYDTVILPEGRSDWPNLFCTPMGTTEHACSLVKIDLQRAESRGSTPSPLFASEF